MNPKYIVVKRSAFDGQIYEVHLETDKELATHVSACFELTNEEIISVIRIPEFQNQSN